MNTATIKHFDLLSFVKRSKKLGVPEPLAEYQGRQIEEAIEVAVASSKQTLEAKNVATQQDLKNTELTLRQDLKSLESRLELKIEQTKNQTILWLGGLLIASGLISHFFH
jgi:hypothetical protein